MPAEFISYRTRDELLHFFNWKSVEEIVDAFCQAEISPPSIIVSHSFRTGDHDSRRNLVERYYRCLDFGSHVDVVRFLRMCVTAMVELESNLSSPEVQERNYSRTKLALLRKCLREDGFEYRAGRLFPLSEQAASWSNVLLAPNGPSRTACDAEATDSVDETKHGPPRLERTDAPGPGQAGMRTPVEQRRLVEELERAKSELLQSTLPNGPRLLAATVHNRTSEEPSQFSVKALMIVTTAHLVGMALARSADPELLPVVASIVGAVSGVCFFPLNRTESGATFGSIGGFMGSFGQHALAAVAFIALGAALGAFVGRTADLLARPHDAPALVDEPFIRKPPRRN